MQTTKTFINGKDIFREMGTNMLKGWGFYRGDALTTSPSKITTLRNCPELFKHRYIDCADEKTESMDFGTVCHMAILEPEKFAQNYVSLPPVTDTNDYSLTQLKEIAKGLELTVSGTKKDLCARIRERYPLETQLDELSEQIASEGKQVLSPSLTAKIDAIKTKVFKHQQLGKFIEIAEKEKSGHYQDPKTGIVINFVADAFCKIGDVGLVLDFKFTKDWSPKWFERSNFEEGRHIQAAAYCRALTELENWAFDRFVFVAIEPVAPHRMRLYEVDHAMLEAGEAELDYYLAEYKRRWETQDWSPRGDDGLIQPTSFTSWAWENVKEVTND